MWTYGGHGGHARGQAHVRYGAASVSLPVHDVGSAVTVQLKKNVEKINSCDSQVKQKSTFIHVIYSKGLE